MGSTSSEKALACFSMVKPSQGQQRLEQVSADLYGLILHFKDCKDVNGMHSLNILQDAAVMAAMIAGASDEANPKESSRAAFNDFK